MDKKKNNNNNSCFYIATFQPKLLKPLYNILLPQRPDHFKGDNMKGAAIGAAQPQYATVLFIHLRTILSRAGHSQCWVPISVGCTGGLRREKA